MNNDLMAEALADAAAAEPAIDRLERVTELANLLAKQDEAVAAAEAKLKEAKAAFNQTRLVDLPELMIEVGLPLIGLEDGTTITLKEEIDCGITAAKKPMALLWLVQNGFGGLIKTKVVTEFAKEDRDAAIECANNLASEYGTVKMDETVHPGTLKSFIKEQMAEGAALPMDLFSIHPYNVATMKRAKK